MEGNIRPSLILVPLIVDAGGGGEQSTSREDSRHRDGGIWYSCITDSFVLD